MAPPNCISGVLRPAHDMNNIVAVCGCQLRLLGPEDKTLLHLCRGDGSAAVHGGSCRGAYSAAA